MLKFWTKLFKKIANDFTILLMSLPKVKILTINCEYNLRELNIIIIVFLKCSSFAYYYLLFSFSSWVIVSFLSKIKYVAI